MLSIPFYSNTKDGLHCVQACLKSVLKFYFPNKNYSFQYLDKVTAHKKGMYTWDYAMLLFLTRKGFDIVYIVDHNLKEFSKKGERYLESIWTDEVFQDQKKYSNFKQEQRLVALLVKNRKINISERSAKFSDFTSLFKKDYILMVAANSLSLGDIKGYSPHMVLVTNITKNFIYFHDPGNPPFPNRKTSIKKFWQAASYPDNSSVDLIAVRYRK